jgi:hypothetical protein
VNELLTAPRGIAGGVLGASLLWELLALGAWALAGCGSSAYVSAMSNPPIPSTAQAASDPPALADGVYLQGGNSVCVVVDNEFTCGSPWVPLTAAWVATAVQIAPTGASPATAVSSWSGDVIINGLPGFATFSTALNFSVTDNASTSGVELIGQISSKPNADGWYPTLSATCDIVMQTGQCQGLVGFVSSDAGTQLVIEARGTNATDAVIRVAVIGEP